MGRMRRLCS